MTDKQGSAVRCHVVAITPALTHVFVLRMAAGWLLPCVASTLLQGVIANVQSMLARPTSVSTIVHAALISWAGPPPSDAYSITLVSGTSRSADAQLVRLSMLQSMPSLLRLQPQALSMSSERQRESRAPFDSAADVSAALGGIEQQLAEERGFRAALPSVYRARRLSFHVPGIIQAFKHLAR